MNDVNDIFSVAKVRKIQKTKERNKRNNERLKEAREYIYSKNQNKIIQCTNCNKEKPMSDFYKSNIHVKFFDKKAVGVETGECKECAKIKQKIRDDAKIKNSA